MPKQVNDAERFLELRRRVEKLQREADRAAGAKDQLLSRMQAEFGCKTVKEAEKRLTREERELQELREGFQAKLSSFEEKWEGVLKCE